jgi:cytidine diphosphoramidate kinase
MVVWVTGLSGAGKTTLCTALRDLIKPRLPELVLLDGDVVRAAFGNNLGYTESDRVVQVRRLQSMAKVLAEQNLVVIVGVLYGNQELLAWNRAHLPDYFEVYLKASLETVSGRDTKSLYATARTGKAQNVVGIDIPWHAPVAPDLVFDADHPAKPAKMARVLASAVPRLRAALPEAAPATPKRYR